MFHVGKLFVSIRWYRDPNNIKEREGEGVKEGSNEFAEEIFRSILNFQQSVTNLYSSISFLRRIEYKK